MIKIFDWTRNRNQIITDALDEIGVVALGTTPTSNQISNAVPVLHRMLATLQVDGNLLWKIEWNTATLTASSEVTGSDGNIYTCIKSHTSAASNKPVTGANYTTYWKLLGETGGVWATSTAYSAIGNIDLTKNILGISEAFWRSGTTDTPIQIVTRAEYFAIPDKTTTGLPNKLWLDTTTLEAPRIHLWPQPDDSTDVLHYGAITRFDTLTSGTTNPDLDPRWIEALVYGLAFRLAGSYGLSPSRKQELSLKAGASFMLAQGGSQENVDLKISPRRR